MIIYLVDTTGEEEPPPIVPTRETGLRFVLTGVDGSTWGINENPVRLMAGAELGPFNPEHWWKDSPTLDGSDWQGMRIPRGEVFLPIRVKHPTSLGFRDLDAAFWRAIDPAGEAVLTVQTPDALYRNLPIRYTDGGAVVYETDPLLLKRANYGLTFAVADPYYQGPEVLVRYEVTDSLPFFAPPGQDPEGVFNFDASNAVATGTITNPGDIEAAPYWVIGGPFTAATVGVGAATTTIEATVAEGESRIIDMRDGIRDITDGNGASAWLEATDVKFAEIPAGTEVPLSLDLTGSDPNTSIELSLTPRYRRLY